MLAIKIKFGLGAQAMAVKRRNLQDASSFIDRESEVDNNRHDFVFIHLPIYEINLTLGIFNWHFIFDKYFALCRKLLVILLCRKQARRTKWILRGAVWERREIREHSDAEESALAAVRDGMDFKRVYIYKMVLVDSDIVEFLNLPLSVPLNDWNYF